MTMKRDNLGRRPPFVHLGDRLLAIGRIRGGMLTVEQAAAQLGVPASEVIGWQQLHAFERTVTIAELRGSRTPQMERLGRRAQRLADLVASAERELRDLHRELIRAAVASNEPFAGRDGNLQETWMKST
jgi:hypothetical protein